MKNSRMIEIDERPRFKRFRLWRGQRTCSLSLLACQGWTATVAGIGFANETNVVRNVNAMPQFPIVFAASPVQAHMANRAKQPKF